MTSRRHQYQTAELMPLRDYLPAREHVLVAQISALKGQLRKPVGNC